jgi:hypothetical protein
MEVILSVDGIFDVHFKGHSAFGGKAFNVRLITNLRGKLIL